MFLGYDWLVKYNLEVNWDKKTIRFTRYLKKYKIQHQNIMFILRIKRVKPIEEMNKGYQKIGKKLNPINLEDLLE